jgi:hypothetical protein
MTGFDQDVLKVGYRLLWLTIKVSRKTPRAQKMQPNHETEGSGKKKSWNASDHKMGGLRTSRGEPVLVTSAIFLGSCCNK